MVQVILDGVSYPVSGEINSRTIDPWAEPIRIVGNKQRVDRINATPWVQESWSAGMGYYRTIGPVPDDPNALHPSYRGFYESILDTRFEGQVTLPPLEEAVTITDSGDDFYRFFQTHANGFNFPALYAVCENASESIALLDSLGTTFDTYKDLASYSNYRPTAITTEDGISRIWGGTYIGIPSPIVQVGTGGTVADFTPTTNMTDFPYDVINFHGTLYASTMDRVNNYMQVQSSTDGGNNWADVSGMGLSIQAQSNSQTTQMNFVEYFDVDGVDAIYLVTNDRLYLCDFANGEFDEIIKFDAYITNKSTYLTRRPVKWGGDLYILRQHSIIKFNAFNGAYTDISPISQGRLPADWSGAASYGVTAAAASDQWLFVGLTGSGGAGAAKIMAWDGQGWHFIWESAGAGACELKDIALLQGISGDVDMYIMYSDGGSSKISVLRKITKNPLTDTGYKYATSGYLTTPNFDGGMADDEAAILASGVSFTSLDAGNEEIKVETAIDYSGTYESGTSEIATFTDATAKLIKYTAGTGTRGAGMPGTAWNHKYTLSRGSTTTKTPVMFSAVTYYRKKPNKIHEYAFLIDLEDAVDNNQYEFTDAENVMAKLHEAEESVELVTLILPGKGAISGSADGTALFVDVEGIPASHTGNEDYQWTPRIKSGTVVIICREVFG